MSGGDGPPDGEGAPVASGDVPPSIGDGNRDLPQSQTDRHAPMIDDGRYLSAERTQPGGNADSTDATDKPGEPPEVRDPSFKRLTPNEQERIRLGLSTYQDGTGRATINGHSFPDWKDFEVSVREALEAGPPVNADDALDAITRDYGLQLKFYKQLDEMRQGGVARVEEFSTGKPFWEMLKAEGITRENYRQHPQEVGRTLMAYRQSLYEEAARINAGGNLRKEDGSLERYLANSSIILGLYNEQGEYQLYQYPIERADANLQWVFSTRQNSEALHGLDSRGNVVSEFKIFDWNPGGGSFHQYFYRQDAQAHVYEPQTLEPYTGRQAPLIERVNEYFGDQWKAAGGKPAPSSSDQSR